MSTITRIESCEDHTCCEATYTKTSCVELTKRIQAESILAGTSLDSDELAAAISSMEDAGIL